MDDGLALLFQWLVPTIKNKESTHQKGAGFGGALARYNKNCISCTLIAFFYLFMIISPGCDMMLPPQLTTSTWFCYIRTYVNMPLSWIFWRDISSFHQGHSVLLPTLLDSTKILPTFILTTHNPTLLLSCRPGSPTGTLQKWNVAEWPDLSSLPPEPEEVLQGKAEEAMIVRMSCCGTSQSGLIYYFSLLGQEIIIMQTQRKQWARVCLCKSRQLQQRREVFLFACVPSASQ